ncbi:hypothetical protein [Paenibacillus chibensis]|nr:hypothetical protein [Paenibacillus chibensis]MEC0373564.1 hypothetical protein [Paenibacillus chibensis]
MNEKWENIKSSAKDAICHTLNNHFDVIKTAKDLNNSYDKKTNENKGE